MNFYGRFLHFLFFFMFPVCLLARDLGPGEWIARSGSSNASIVEVTEGEKAARLPCRFASSNIPRGCWDWPVRLDLGKYQGIEFKFSCSDRSPVSNFTLYLHSGDGWYVAPFDIEDISGWTTVRINKADTTWEGDPGGWGNIDIVRFSAWRAGNSNTDIHVAGFRCYGGPAPITVIRGEDTGKEKHEAAAMAKFARTVSRQLDELGIPHTFISDSDVTPGILKDTELVVLAYCPALPARAVDVLGKYIRSGGNLLSFYILPGKLEREVGIRVGEHVNQQYPGQFASIRPLGDNILGLPPVTGQNSWNIHRAYPTGKNSRVIARWHDTEGKDTGEPAIVMSGNCVFMTHVFIEDDPVNKRNMLLAMVGRSCPELVSSDAIARRSAVEKKRRKELEEYCRAQKPEPGEHRAFWCHDAFGVEGMSWDTAVQHLADNGFTAILPNMAWAGVAFYRSDVLPVAPAVRTRGDQVAECAAACRKHGVECHVWKVCWNMGSRTEKAFAGRMQSAGRTQVSRDGTVSERWLCPSHPENRRMEIESMLELVENYDIDGVHFDYIRYPGEDHCYCEGCRKKFEEMLGRKVKNWPRDTIENRKTAWAWRQFRRDNITTIVREVSERARKVKPGIKISAAVFHNWSVDRDNIGQDWKRWCDKGYVDFVCPMNYTSSNANFEQMATRQVKWAGDVPCYPGIGLSTWSRSGDTRGLIEKVLITRRLKTGGFTVFEYGPSEARDVVPLCALGLTKE